MQTYLPPWPATLPRTFRPLATFPTPKTSSRAALDRACLTRARLLRREQEAVQCSGQTGTWTELLFSNRANFTAFNTSSSEGSLLAGLNEQPVLHAFFLDGTRGFGRAVTILAQGVLSTTGTPTIIFQTRLGTTAGSSYLGGTSVGVSAAITTASGVTNKWWQLRLDLVCNTPGIGSGNTTLSGAGYVMSPGGFASPFIYALEPTTPDTATWTSTVDSSLAQFLNLSVTWSASSASNTITCQQLLATGHN